MRLIIALAIALFMAQAWFGARHKGPNLDAGTHYRYGETLLGSGAGEVDSLPGDGTGPCVALHAWSARTFTPRDTPLDDVAVTERGTIPSLRWARLPGIVGGALLLLLLAWFATRYAGRVAGASVALLGSLTPELIGHSRFIATDLLAALGFATGVIALAVAFEKPTVARLCLLAVVLAIAQLTKITNLLLYPLAAVAIAGRAAHLAFVHGPRWRHAIVAALLATVVAVASLLGVLHAAHAGINADVAALLDTPPARRLVRTHFPLGWTLRDWLPNAYSHVIALGNAHNSVGHPSYLLGRWSHDGWPHYYLVALLIKTPIPILLLGAIGLVTALRRRMRPLLLAAACALAYGVYFSLAIDVHIGSRHALPLVAIGLLLAGVGVATIAALPARRIVVGVLVGWLGLQTAAVFPHHASYFNEIAGGSEQGWRWLIDSNVDWGQDRWIAERWARTQPRPVAIAPTEPTAGLVVVGANDLIGLLPEHRPNFAWLREHYRPVNRLSPALFVFDVPAEPAATADR